MINTSKKLESINKIFKVKILNIQADETLKNEAKNALTRITEEEYKSLLELNTFREESIITLGQSTIKAAFTINGGAAIAILTFISEKNLDRISLDSFINSVSAFSYGVLFAALSAATTYVSRRLLTETYIRSSKMFNALSIFFIVGSFAIFLYGVHNLS